MCKNRKEGKNRLRRQQVNTKQVNSCCTTRPLTLHMVKKNMKEASSCLQNYILDYYSNFYYSRDHMSISLYCVMPQSIYKKHKH